MNILVFGDVYPDSFAKNIVLSLRVMGHSTAALEHPLVRYEGKHWIARLRCAFYVRRLFPKLNECFYRSFERTADALQPDLVLVVRQVPPRIIEKIKRTTKAKIVSWFPDAVSNLGRQEILTAPYDAVFFKDGYMVETFREKLGLNAYLLPEACNPAWHRRVEMSEEERRFYGCDLTVAGNAYAYRALLLESFLGYDVKFWGGDWPPWLDSPVKKFHQGRYVAEVEKAKAYTAAKIVVNTMHYAEIAGFNLRMFEAAGCGAFQIIDWRPALHELFVPEQEIVTFRSKRELKEKVDYYLAHPEERAAIAARGYARAHAEHTYPHRLARLLEVTFNGN